MKCIVAGPRNHDDYNFVREKLLYLFYNGFPELLIEGGATGIDAEAKRFAEENNIPHHQEPALWELYGKSAGPRRNKTMAEKATHAVVFISHSNPSPGSSNMIKTAKEHHLILRIIYLP